MIVLSAIQYIFQYVMKCTLISTVFGGGPETRSYKRRPFLRKTLPAAIVVTILLFIVISGLLYMLSLYDREDQTNNDVAIQSQVGRDMPYMHVAAAACGEESHRKVELATMIKSCVLFSYPYNVHFHVFATETMQIFLKENVANWPVNIQSTFKISFYKPYFPSTKWENMYRRCSTLRLFMPLALPKYVKHIVYIDTDAIAIGPIRKLWDEFKNFTSSQKLGMTFESVIDKGWYDFHLDIPVPVKHGVNAGILLMDVEKIRNDKTGWLASLEKIADKQSTKNLMGDQDILNEYLFHNPDQLHIFPCEYNFRPNFCSTKRHSGCPTAYNNGIVLLHGSNFTLHDKTHLFHYIFHELVTYDFSGEEKLLERFNAMKSFNRTLRCFQSLDLLLKYSSNMLISD